MARYLSHKQLEEFDLACSHPFSRLRGAHLANAKHPGFAFSLFLDLPLRNANIVGIMWGKKFPRCCLPLVMLLPK